MLCVMTSHIFPPFVRPFFFKYSDRCFVNTSIGLLVEIIYEYCVHYVHYSKGFELLKCIPGYWKGKIYVQELSSPAGVYFCYFTTICKKFGKLF